MGLWLILLTLGIVLHTPVSGILYPRESESREVVSLDGIWKFRVSPTEAQDKGFAEKWFSRNFEEWIQMPVPSSYNDVTVNSTVRDFVGWAWYQHEFYPPKRWRIDAQRVVLRFGSVHYTALVWVNDKKACEHSGGHLPFEADVTQLLLYGTSNLVTVAVNNTLNLTTLPQGYVQHPNDTARYPPGYVLFHHDFDFFNYAGIHRPVYLYTTPQIYIHDITVITDIDQNAGIIKYIVEYKNKQMDQSSTPQCTVTVFGQNGTEVKSVKGVTGKIYIPKANFWWPYLTSPHPGYLYTLKVHLTFESGQDIYRLPVGIRKVTWNSTTFFINNVPTYIRGFGKHEDSNLRGKGLDYPLLIRDYNLIAWLGANAYRTSHYPYSEEALDMADALGIMIIGESPACTIDYFTGELLEKHKEVMTEMVRRDKNRPSVVMWSLSNEPKSFRNESREYFSALVNLTKSLDPTRAVTFVTSQAADKDQAVQFMDIVCVNRYPAWYSDSGRTDLIQLQVKNELITWHLKFKKPVLITEYGAGSVIGMHMIAGSQMILKRGISDVSLTQTEIKFLAAEGEKLAYEYIHEQLLKAHGEAALIAPSSMWTEDYQVVTLKEHFKAFDTLYKEGFLIGEMIWNFADFATPQEFTRPGGCKKGLFTRERQPKMAAHITRWRYWTLAHSAFNVTLPNDLLFVGS